MAMHTIGDSTFKTNMRGFEFEDSNQDDSAPAKLAINVEAHASVTLQPKLTLGLWADMSAYGLSIDAEFYLKMWVDLEARADFQFKVGGGVGARLEGVIPAITLDACNQAKLGCHDSDSTDSHQACTHVHDTQLGFRLSAEIRAAYKVYAKAGWGDWQKEHCSNKLPNGQCVDTDVDHGIAPFVLQGYFCWHLTEKCPAIGNGQCGAKSCDQLVGQPVLSSASMLGLGGETISSLGITVTGGCRTAVGGAGALTYAMQGTTASGAPYYKAEGESYWLYWDPDCGGSGNSPRWIFDSSAPSTTAANDLDEDGRCSYYNMRASKLTPPPRLHRASPRGQGFVTRSGLTWT
jgi:hypothetical protein